MKSAAFSQKTPDSGFQNEKMKFQKMRITEQKKFNRTHIGI